MTDTDQAKSDKKESDRVAAAEQKKEADRVAAEQKAIDERTAKAYEHEKPYPSQAEADEWILASQSLGEKGSERGGEKKRDAKKDAAEIEKRVAKAYEHETPTPTQAELDAAMETILYTEPLPPGSGLTPVPPPPPDELTPLEPKRRTIEADKPGAGYATRAAAPTPATPQGKTE